MHAAQRAFIERIRSEHPEFFTDSRVLELGSYNINGTVRDFFTDPQDYVGVDHRPGPCVDEVALCHTLNLEREFDVLISSEMLEHDPHWRSSLAAGVRHLRKGGLVVITCASQARGRHEVHTSPEKDYYAGVPAYAVAKEMGDLGVGGTAEEGDGGQDTYYAGFLL